MAHIWSFGFRYRYVYYDMRNCFGPIDIFATEKFAPKMYFYERNALDTRGRIWRLKETGVIWLSTIEKSRWTFSLKYKPMLLIKGISLKFLTACCLNQFRRVVRLYEYFKVQGIQFVRGRAFWKCVRPPLLIASRLVIRCLLAGLLPADCEARIRYYRWLQESEFSGLLDPQLAFNCDDAWFTLRCDVNNQNNMMRAQIILMLFMKCQCKI
jgi:hypothetical protein